MKVAKLTSFKLMYSSGKLPTELTGHGRPRRVDCKKKSTSILGGQIMDTSKESETKQNKKTKDRIQYDHEWCNISLIDIDPFNVIKAPFCGCWCIMSMFINKPKITTRMVGLRDWLGITSTSPPNDKGCISVSRMTITMTTCQTTVIRSAPVT